jgi:hypothetical protein
MAASNNTIEVWKPIAGYEELYSVSNLGHIRRDARGPHTHIGKILKLRSSHNGYLRVGLLKNYVKGWYFVHRLVMQAFLERCPADMQVNHKDADKTNNTFENLEYVTPKQNGAHATAMGLYLVGSSHPRSRLNEWQVRVIKRLIPVMPNTEIAKMFTVSKSTVCNIRNGRTWRHV